MFYYFVFFILCLIPLFWVTLRGKDAYPFSHYPMFSNLCDIKDVEIFRIALETNDGKLVWWKSEFYRYPEIVGRKLKELYQIENDTKDVFLSLEKQRLFSEVLRLIEAEEKISEKYQSFRIVMRTAREDERKHLTIQEETVAILPFEGIKKIRCDN